MTVVAEKLEMESSRKSIQSATGFPPASLAWLIWGCAALFYLYEYVLRVSPSVMAHDLMRDFGVTSTALGVLSSFYYYAYVPLQIPCGVIVDRLGVRRVVAFSALLCAVGSYLFSQSDNLFIAQAARFMIGAGSACGYLSCAKVGADWFPPHKFAVIAGITMMMGTFGGTFGGLPIATLVNIVGWRQAMILSALVGFAITAASWLIIRDHKNTVYADQSNVSFKQEASLLDGLRAVATSKQCWLVGIYGGLMYVPLSAFAELWGVPYLMKSHNVNNEIASLGSAMVFIGMGLGSALGAALSNKLGSRVKIMSWAALTTLVPFAAVIYIPGIPLNLTFALLFLAGLFCGGQILYFAAAQEITPPSFSGTTVGFINALVMASGVIFQPLLGLVLDFVWDGMTATDGTPIYTMNDYQHALSVVPICLLVAWFIMRFVRETYSNPTEVA